LIEDKKSSKAASCKRSGKLTLAQIADKTFIVLEQSLLKKKELLFLKSLFI
jgi:hypothetical protein